VPIDSPRGTVLRTLLALCAVIALLGACSSNKSPTKAEASSTSTTSVKQKNPCLLDRRDLSGVTGIQFDQTLPLPGQDSCIYTSTEGAAAINLHLTSLGGNSPTQAIDEATTTCDAGSVVRIDFKGADGGFSCIVKGVATVGAAGQGVFVVLTGATDRDAVPTARILADLATILDHALTGA
jgi:hypothetical protein